MKRDGNDHANALYNACILGSFLCTDPLTALHGAVKSSRGSSRLQNYEKVQNLVEIHEIS